MLPRSGDVVRIGAAASVQFADGRGFLFRVIKVRDWTTYDEWVWLDGYQLNRDGDAVERRSIFVQIAGIEPAGIDPPARPRATNTGPRVPRQRTPTTTTPTPGRTR